MLANNLHLEKTAQLPELSNQGLKRQTQGDSSFFDLLQKEMSKPLVNEQESFQKTKEARDGQNNEIKDTQKKADELTKDASIENSKEGSKLNDETNTKKVVSNAEVNDKELENLELLALNEDEENAFFDFEIENEEVFELSDAHLDFLHKDIHLKESNVIEINEDGKSLKSIFTEDSESQEVQNHLKELSAHEQEEILQKLLAGTLDLNSLKESFVQTEEADNLKLPQKDISLIGKENALISVIDERTLSSEGKKTQNFVKSIQFDAKNQEANIHLGLNSESAFAKSLELSNGKGIESRFESMLAQELKNSAFDLVKTGSIILRDNNSGLINLFLKPEALGDVKIRLQISDTVITAKIIVESQEALNAFKDSIGSLKEAFEQGGFETGNFDLSWSGNGSSGQEKDEQNAKAHFYTEALPELVENDAESNERILALMKNALQYGTSIVNVVA